MPFQWHLNNFCPLSDLSHVSNRLVTVAKDNGSTDNITIVVVFLKPIEQLIKEHKQRKESNSGPVSQEILYKAQSEQI